MALFVLKQSGALVLFMQSVLSFVWVTEAAKHLQKFEFVINLSWRKRVCWRQSSLYVHNKIFNLKSCFFPPL
jgi:hypothetical protein